MHPLTRLGFVLLAAFGWCLYCLITELSPVMEGADDRTLRTYIVLTVVSIVASGGSFFTAHRFVCAEKRLLADLSPGRGEKKK